ncbi:site-specific integrase [Solibacillus sp. MA9]|uniref:Site-specific integrase n=1 Tax=Solibacillus palustris TaxID=2908203 RepID=A0ABS9UDU2_9BACL|nr:site-specific integrase [Solibacillus sp. MA9]MCH7322506.1 site-specific integrase [Solibacillus sp. MA9]
MAIEKSLNISLEEICNQLGVSENSLLDFLGSAPNRESIIDNEKTALYVLEKYQEHLINLVKLNKRSEETLKTYNNFILRIKKFLLLNYPNLQVNELNEIIINEIITKDNEYEHSFSVRTINKYYAIMKSFLKFAYEMDYTNKDFRNKFQLEKTSLLPRYIKEAQIKKILETVEHLFKPYRCRAIIMFLLLTGCRVSEVSKIKVKDFNVMENLIYIYNGKGKKDRVIPMFPELKGEILMYLQKSGMSNWHPQCEGFLFARDEGIVRNRNFPIRTIEHLVERIRKHQPELSSIKVHSFRHTFAVFCLKIGIKEHHLTEILGHSDPKTTMTYTKLRGEDLRDEIINKFPYPFEILLSTISEDKK